MEVANVRVITSQPRTSEEDRLERFRVLLQQTGGDPSSLLELLSTIVKNRDWRRLEDGRGGSQTFAGYFESIGWPKSDLVRFVEAMRHRHERPPRIRQDIKAQMDELRAAVRDLANPALLAPGPPIGNTNAGKPVYKEGIEEESEFKHDIVMVDKPQGRSSSLGNSTGYTLGRLKRDHPELAEKVIQGEMSANRAAVAAGFRKPPTVLPADPVRAAKLITSRFNRTQIEVLMRELVNWCGLEVVESSWANLPQR